MSTFYFDPTKPANLTLVVESDDEVVFRFRLVDRAGTSSQFVKGVLRGPARKVFRIPLRNPVTLRWSVSFTDRRRATSRVYLLLSQENKTPKLLAVSVPAGGELGDPFSLNLLPASMKASGPRKTVREPPAPPPKAWGGGPLPPSQPTRKPRAKRASPSSGSVRGTQIASTTEKDILYRVWFGTNRRPAPGLPLNQPFLNERDDAVHHGFCNVFIPESHKIGSLGSPWWKRILKADDRVVLRTVTELSEKAFWKQLARACQLIPENDRQALVYIHGYNTSFREAARRAGQLGADLSIQGAMGFFSWPSKGTKRGYIPDTAAIESSEADIANFLAGFAAQSGSDRVHVIAHSMGNRGLLCAISRIVNDASKLSKCRFTHLVLAAPDVDTNVFMDLAVNFAKVAKRATLYISDKDVLLEASSWLHDYPRAGIRPPVTLVPRVDTIDVGKVDLSFLGHSYVGATRAVITDMYHLLHNDATPPKRSGLRELFDPGGAKYWMFRA